MKRLASNRWIALALAMAMVLSGTGMSTVAQAASKAPKVSSTKVRVNVGKSKKVTLKKKPAGAKVTWTTANKKIAKVKRGKITGVKAGSTKVTCKVVYKKAKKKVTKKFVIKVTVKKATAAATTAPSAAVPAATNTAAPAPAATATVVPTAAPTASPDSVYTITNLTTEHQSANGITTKDNGLMRKELSSLDLINNVMGPGWNLGNQMEQSNCMDAFDTVEGGETSAGNPVASQATFDGLKSYGINTVRVPVAWSNFMEGNDGTANGEYKINEELFDRVETIINYALNDEMYVIINIHWDGGWWGRFGAEAMDAEDTPIRDGAWKKYEAIWTQISERFKEYSDHLIFEGANEELSGRLNDDYTHPEKGQANQTGKLDKNADDIYKMVNAINQKFVDIVRASGGNNAYRHLLIPGTGNESCVIGGYSSDSYATDGTMDERYQMPKDTDENGKSKLSVSVHYYDPTDYGISATSTTSWGYRDSWGTEADYEYLDNLMGRMKKFSDEGYGIIIGECGCVKGYKDDVIDYLKAIYDKSAEIGACAVLWDEGHYFEREKGYFAYGDVGEFFANRTGSTPTIPEGAKLIYTGVSIVPTSENNDPKVMYTWTGRFLRHTGDGEIPAQMLEKWGNKDEGGLFDPILHGIAVTDSITDGAGNPTDLFTPVINEEYWNIHMLADWNNIEEPCIRVYPDDDAVSQSADLQVGYMKKGNGSAKFAVDYDQGTGQFWPGKYVKLDAEALKGDYPWLWITTNTYTGCSFVKIEICDGAYNADGTKYSK